MLQAIPSRIKDKRLSEEDVTNNVLKSLEIGDDSQLNSETKSSKGVTDYPILEFDENALQLLHEGVSNTLKYSKVVPAKGRLYEAVKRLFDIVASACALALLVIPIGIVALAIYIDDKGNPFFSQVRLTKNGKPFKMYKFRSMGVQSASKEQKAWTVHNDPRVTPVGRIIRKTSLDELPQLFNVLKGDMSLIGPRPERPLFVEKFKEEIPRYMIKHQVRPGMTGWAQVCGFRGDTSIEGRIEHDIFYIENWTLSFDIKILFLTVFKGFVNKNAY